MPISPAIKREEVADGATPGTSSAIAKLYHQLTGDDLRRVCDLKQENMEAFARKRKEDADDDDDDEDNDDEHDEPCDLRIFTPDTCLREMNSPLGSGDFAHSSTMVPYLPGTVLPALAETLISITGGSYKTSPAGTSSTGTAGGMPTGSATIPALRNIRVPPGSGTMAGSSGLASGPSGSGNLGGGSNQTTPGGAYSCHRCGNSYARPHSLNRHIRFECGVEPKFECPVCHKKSKHKHNLVLHMRTHQQR